MTETETLAFYFIATCFFTFGWVSFLYFALKHLLSGPKRESESSEFVSALKLHGAVTPREKAGIGLVEYYDSGREVWFGGCTPSGSGLWTEVELVFREADGRERYRRYRAMDLG
jgi:hypothetical protein